MSAEKIEKTKTCEFYRNEHMFMFINYYRHLDFLENLYFYTIYDYRKEGLFSGIGDIHYEDKRNFYNTINLFEERETKEKYYVISLFALGEIRDQYKKFEYRYPDPRFCVEKIVGILIYAKQQHVKDIHRLIDIVDRFSKTVAKRHYDLITQTRIFLTQQMFLLHNALKDGFKILDDYPIEFSRLVGLVERYFIHPIGEMKTDINDLFKGFSTDVSEEVESFVDHVCERMLKLFCRNEKILCYSIFRIVVSAIWEVFQDLLRHVESKSYMIQQADKKIELLKVLLAYYRNLHEINSLSKNAKAAIQAGKGESAMTSLPAGVLTSIFYHPF